MHTRSHRSLNRSPDFDPEDLHPPGPQSEDEAHEDSAAAREHYVDVGLVTQYYLSLLSIDSLLRVSRPSSLRQLNQSISDPKYEGTRVSRRDLIASEESLSSTDNSDVEDEDIAERSSPERASSPNHLVHDDVQRPPQPPAEHASQTRPEESQQKPPHASDLASTLRATRQQDREKGKAVVRQIVGIDMPLQSGSCSHGLS